MNIFRRGFFSRPSRCIAVLLILAGIVICLKACLIPAPAGGYTDRGRLVLIIDPGHGGADGGANTGNVLESSLNLSIALKMDSIMGLFAVPVILTRESEDIDYPQEAKTIRAKKVYDTKRRVELIKSIPNPVVISIHQNKFPDDYPHGAQSFFSKNHGSEELAKNTQELLVRILDSQNKREARRVDSGIYLMNNISCPSVLVECGFLSNPRELELLQTEEYRTKIAVTISAAFLNTTEILEGANGKG